MVTDIRMFFSTFIRYFADDCVNLSREFRVYPVAGADRRLPTHGFFGTHPVFGRNEEIDSYFFCAQHVFNHQHQSHQTLTTLFHFWSLSPLAGPVISVRSHWRETQIVLKNFQLSRESQAKTMLAIHPEGERPVFGARYQFPQPVISHFAFL